MVKSIVDQHQGRIEVRSGLGVGTRFTIWWPAASPPTDTSLSSPMSEVLTGSVLLKSEGTEKVETQVAVIPPSSEQAQILIVEDDSTWLEIAARRLQSSDYHIIQTRKAADAVQIMQEKKCDLVLLDWNMPGIGGIGVLEKARELKLGVPIIILSAYGDTEQQDNASRLKAKAFIRKPGNKIQWDELKQMISQTMAHK